MQRADSTFIPELGLPFPNKNIVHLISRLRPCGPVNVLYALAEEFYKNGNPITIVTIHSEHEQSLYEKFLPIVKQIYCLNVDNSLKWINSITRLQKILSLIQPTILHSHGIKPDFLASALGKFGKMTKISTVHSDLRSDYRYSFGRGRGNIYSYIHLKILNTLNSLIAVSGCVEDSLRGSINIPIYKIHNGVKIVNRSSDDIHEDSLLFKEFTDSAPIAMSVGHLTSLKNSVQLAKLISGLSEKINLHAIFLGDGLARTACEEILKKSGRGKCKGVVMNVSDYLSNSNLYISASKCEGMPMAALEAMSYGLPMLLSNIPAHSEISISCPQKILLFDPENSEDFRKKLIHILEKQPRSGDSDIIQAFENHYSASIMANSYNSLYSNLLSSHPLSPLR